MLLMEAQRAREAYQAKLLEDVSTYSTCPAGGLMCIAQHDHPVLPRWRLDGIMYSPYLYPWRSGCALKQAVPVHQ
jgi:hypothetical protein